jgi:hypothetical protein
VLESGNSPLQKKASAKADATARRVTFEEFALECVEAKGPEWQKSKYGDQWVFTLTEYAFPVIGAKSLGEIDTEA